MTSPAAYERTVEIFGRTMSYTVTERPEARPEPVPLTWVVRDEYGVLLAGFLVREHACRYVDLMIGELV